MRLPHFTVITHINILHGCLFFLFYCAPTEYVKKSNEGWVIGVDVGLDRQKRLCIPSHIGV